MMEYQTCLRFQIRFYISKCN